MRVASGLAGYDSDEDEFDDKPIRRPTKSGDRSKAALMAGGDDVDDLDPDFDYMNGKLGDEDDVEAREMAHRQKRLLQDPNTQRIVIEGGEDCRGPGPPTAMAELLKGLKRTPANEMDESAR